MDNSKATQGSDKTPSPITLNGLPNELLERIANYMPASDLTVLAATNKKFHRLFNQSAQQRLPIELMEYVLKPTEENVKRAKAMIAATPKIMFIETVGVEWASGVEEVVDATGKTRTRVVPRIVKSSPFKAALGTGDKELYNYMAEHLNKVVYKNEKGETKETGIQRAQRQLKEQFPNGFEYPPVEEKFTDLMIEIVHAIRNDQSLIENRKPAPTTKALLKNFRHYFLPKNITQGHHFNPNYLIEAFTVYNENCSTWNYIQQSIFWCQVIGYLERLVPAVDAQAFCQGLYYLLERKQPLTRSLTLTNNPSSFRIDYFLTTGLGFDLGIYIGRTAGKAGSIPEGINTKVDYVKYYFEQKQQSLTTFNNALNNGLSSNPENHPIPCTIL